MQRLVAAARRPPPRACARRSLTGAAAAAAAVATAAAVAPPACCDGSSDGELEECDVLVVGGGVVGLSTAYHLARRGKRVLLCNAGHSVRGSWGESRAAHLAQTDSVRLRMARRGIGWYKRLEQETGISFLIHSERLNIGPLSAIDNLCNSYLAHDVAHTRLSPSEVDSRWERRVQLAPEEQAVLISDGWTVLASEALRALASAAEAEGAVLVDGEAVVSIDANKQLVRTDSGRVVRYHQAMVLAAGAWTNQLLRLADLPLLPIAVTEEQTVQFAMRPASSTGNTLASLPLITHTDPAKQEYFYCVPPVDRPGCLAGCKVGFHQRGMHMCSTVPHSVRFEFTKA